MIDFSNKTIIITGASRGIGEATAHLLSEQGAHVVLAARSADDIERCIAATGADGVLIGEAALENPAIFEGGRVGDAQGALAEEYLGIAGQQPTPLMGVKQHLFQMLYAGLQVTPIAEKIAEKAAGDAVSSAATRAGAP